MSGQKFSKANKQITSIENDDCFLVGQLVDGVYRQKWIKKSDANVSLPQDLGTDASPHFAGVEVNTLRAESSAFIEGIEIGSGNPIFAASGQPSKKMAITIGGVSYYILLQEAE